MAERRGLKGDALWKWRECGNEGRTGEGSAEGLERGSAGRCADPREGLRAPEAERARGPGLLEAALGSRRPGRRRREHGGRAAGRPWPGAGRRRHPQPAPFLPPSARPHLPSLAFLSPSALLAGRKDVLLPFPCGRPARPLPGLRFPPRLRRGPRGACDAGPALGSLGSFWRLQGLASCPQRWPPSPTGGKNWLPFSVEPVGRAGARKGVPSL